jgi:hypothetical protein
MQRLSAAVQVLLYVVAAWLWKTPSCIPALSKMKAINTPMFGSFPAILSLQRNSRLSASCATAALVHRPALNAGLLRDLLQFIFLRSHNNFCCLALHSEKFGLSAVVSRLGCEVKGARFYGAKFTIKTNTTKNP